MEYKFNRYHGALLINMINRFLREHGKDPLPHIYPDEKKVVYKEKDKLIISFACTKSKHGYYEIVQYTNNGTSQVIKTPVFYYIRGRKSV